MSRKLSHRRRSNTYQKQMGNARDERHARRAGRWPTFTRLQGEGRGGAEAPSAGTELVKDIEATDSGTPPTASKTDGGTHTRCIITESQDNKDKEILKANKEINGIIFEGAVVRRKASFSTVTPVAGAERNWGCRVPEVTVHLELCCMWLSFPDEGK